MHRYNGLYDSIISLDNLHLADNKARRGKHKQRSVLEFDKDREGNILRLHEELKTGTYRTSPYTCFKVYEPKERDIFRLPYRDRVVHHAIMNVIEPIFLSVFTYNTYSCIPKRGITACAKQVEKIIRSFGDAQRLYCLKIDIRKFYPSIDHGVLKTLLRRKFKDTRLLALLDEIIDSGDGLPIGNYLSQYLSNFYLTYFMHYVNEVMKVKATEYADDIVFFADSKTQLHEVFSTIKDYLEHDLHLTVKGNYQIFPIADHRSDPHGRGLDYVGFVFYRHQKLIRKTIKQRFCRRLAQLRRQNASPETIKREIAAWLGWAYQSNSINLLKTLRVCQESITHSVPKI